jgi:hypothetical protein
MRMSQQNRRDSSPIARDRVGDLLAAGDISTGVDDALTTTLAVTARKPIAGTYQGRRPRMTARLLLRRSVLLALDRC